MPSTQSCALLAAAALLPLSAFGATVTSNADSGEGTLRAALEAGETTIEIDPSVGDIDLDSPLVYAGREALTLRGSGQTIDGAGFGTDPILTLADGASLKVSDLTFDAGGGDEDGPYERLVNEGGGKAIFIDVPLDATGVVSLAMRDVVVRGTGNHGVHVSDCVLDDGDPDACGAGATGDGEGSDAGVRVHLVRVLIEESGFGKQDADGLRVDERGPGSIFFYSKDSTFYRVGADGVELDEGGVGRVAINVRDNAFIENGEFCLVGPFDPEDGDDPCNDDGEPDVDDGFDIDEEGPGSIVGYVISSQVVDNYDEGLDFDEAGSGGTNLHFYDIYSDGNEDEGIKVSEEDGGDNKAELVGVITDGDLEFEEEGNGHIVVSLTDSAVGDDLQFEEADHGVVDISIYDSIVADEVQVAADDGIENTIDGYYKVRNSDIGDTDFEGYILEY